MKTKILALLMIGVALTGQEAPAPLAPKLDRAALAAHYRQLGENNVTLSLIFAFDPLAEYGFRVRAATYQQVAHDIENNALLLP